MSYLVCIALSIFFIVTPAKSQNWSEEATLPGSSNCFDFHGHNICLSDKDRSNILNLTENEWEKHIFEGAKHTSNYPVETTGMLVPYRPLKEFFNEEQGSELKKLISKFAGKVLKMNSLSEIYDWLGLNKLPDSPSPLTPNKIPTELKSEDMTHLGVSFVEKYNTKALTMSCATCHSSTLFGVEVMGLTNRFPRANDFFIIGKKGLGITNKFLFEKFFKATKEEMQIFKDSKRNVKFIEAKSPIVLGLDASLAQVGLSLSRRAHDEFASLKPINSKFPRKSEFRKNPADSKPSVWWNLKYKTRWLSDGSILSGNPVFTNLLWNEIGRGSDLKELDKWIEANPEKMNELTAYVFAAKAPLYDDFFPNEIKIDLAKKGQKLFVNNCSGCHGLYDKGWNEDSSHLHTYRENIKTVKVRYHSKTPVIDVGTDPLRYKGMIELAPELNRLKISQKRNVIAKAQKGYVPPPLVGIWSRFPYFHNNSVPTLYDVLTPESKRPKTYRMTEVLSKETDFDMQKNGYPMTSKMREPFKSSKKYLYDTKKLGMSNMGHTKGILVDENGIEKFNHDEKLAIIEFLKTL